MTKPFKTMNNSKENNFNAIRVKPTIPFICKYYFSYILRNGISDFANWDIYKVKLSRMKYLLINELKCMTSFILFTDTIILTIAASKLLWRHIQPKQLVLMIDVTMYSSGLSVITQKVERFLKIIDRMNIFTFLMYNVLLK